MSDSRRLLSLLAILMLGLSVTGCQSLRRTRPDASRKAASPATPKKVRRYAAVIGIKPEKIEEYKRLHANTWPEVLQDIKANNIQNYSLYLTQLPDGKFYLFMTMEHVGDDAKKDLKKAARSPRVAEWNKLTTPCLIPLPNRRPNEEWWMSMEEVFHTD